MNLKWMFQFPKSKFYVYPANLSPEKLRDEEIHKTLPIALSLYMYRVGTVFSKFPH